MSRSPTEIIAAALHDVNPVSLHANADVHAEAVLAALADAGWSLYRPDECATVECFPSGLAGERVNFDGQYLQVWDTHAGTFGTMPPSGTYRLVPVEGENP